MSAENRGNHLAGEREYFDTLVRRTQATWWGDRTPAAQIREAARVRLVAERLTPADGAVLIEVGCGIGNLSVKLAEAFPRCRLIGVDLSPEAIRVAREQHGRPNVEYRAGDCTALAANLGPGSADFVVGRSILHHLPDLPAALRAFHDVLRPGGRLFFSEPNPTNLHTWVVSRSRYLQRLDQWSAAERPVSAKQFRSLLPQHGLFTDVSVEPFDFVHPALPLWLARIVDRVNGPLATVPVLRHLAGSLIVQATKPGVEGR